MREPFLSSQALSLTRRMEIKTRDFLLTKLKYHRTTSLLFDLLGGKGRVLRNDKVV
jgi:hypothetical protein